MYLRHLKINIVAFSNFHKYIKRYSNIDIFDTPGEDDTIARLNEKVTAMSPYLATIQPGVLVESINIRIWNDVLTVKMRIQELVEAS